MGGVEWGRRGGGERKRGEGSPCPLVVEACCSSNLPVARSSSRFPRPQKPELDAIRCGLPSQNPHIWPSLSNMTTIYLGNLGPNPRPAAPRLSRHVSGPSVTGDETGCHVMSIWLNPAPLDPYTQSPLPSQTNSKNAQPYTPKYSGFVPHHVALSHQKPSKIQPVCPFPLAQVLEANPDLAQHLLALPPRRPFRCMPASEREPRAKRTTAAVVAAAGAIAG